MELKPEILAKVKIFILAGPQDRFTEEEFEVLKSFVDNGGSLWVLLGEGGENEFNTNVNFFLEQYGIYINSGKYDYNSLQNIIRLIELKSIFRQCYTSTLLQEFPSKGVLDWRWCGLRINVEAYTKATGR